MPTHNPCTAPQVDPSTPLSDADVVDALTLREIDVGRMSQQPKLTELDILAYLTNDSTYAQVRGHLRSQPVPALTSCGA